MENPESIKEHETKYKPDAWKAYSAEELASWVGLLAKRATMRATLSEASSDLIDSRNYLDMLVCKIQGR